MRIEVDPDALIAAGQRMRALGSQLSSLSGALGEALSGGIAAGADAAGLNFGLKYGHQTEDFANAVADAANAFNSVGFLLEATGYNYKNADAASTIGGPEPSGGVSGEPSTTTAHVPAGPNGVTVPPPTMWHLIQPLLQALPGVGAFAGMAMTWPSGNSAMMGLTAVQWRNLATGFAAIEPQLAGIKSVVSAQSIPEGAVITSALDSLGQATSSLADVASSVAQAVSEFAIGVQQAQDAIRRLMDRLSFGGLWDTVTGFLTGEGDDILREVARDVGTVLNNFQQQVKGIVGLLEELTVLIGDAATAFQKWTRPILVEQFGDGVGGLLAEAVKQSNDFQIGALTGLINSVSGTVALADADTWRDLAEVALSVAQDPSTLPGVQANMAKELVVWDKWSGENPGRAAGETAFNFGSLVAPGGLLSKTGSLTKGLRLTRRMFDERRLPQWGELRSWTLAAPGVGGAPRVPEIPPVRPGAIPPASRPDSPTGAGPGRLGEPAPSSPSTRPSAPSAEGGPGPRAPVDQPGRAPAEAAPRSESATSSPAAKAPDSAGSGAQPSRAPEPSAPTPMPPNGLPSAAAGAAESTGADGSDGRHAKPEQVSGPAARASDSALDPGSGTQSVEHDGDNSGGNAQQEHATRPDVPEPTHSSEVDSHGGRGDDRRLDSIGADNSSDHPADFTRDYDSNGQTIPTDDLVHPNAGLLDQRLIDDAASNPDRLSEGLSAGAPSTHPEVQNLIPPGYDPLGGQTADAWNREYWPSAGRDAHGNPELVWPDPQTHPQGFDTPESRTPSVLNPGEMFDRFGPGFGQFGSPLGTEFPERALPPYSVDAGYHRYEVVRPIPIWQGPIAPAMGQLGGGIQYYFPTAIVDLVNAGYLREVPV